ncbi:MAG: PorV/PorQ family protein [Ignavibacteriales bacterium]|nr:PorV/PorQ family protein [Ignavibacteriales bacterium]
MIKKILSIALISFTFVNAQSAGNTGLSFLKFGFGARNIAMGDAGTSASNDLTALFYNPAKLNINSDNEILVMHNEWIQDVRSEVLGAKTNIFGLPFAFGFNVTSVSDIQLRTKAGDPESTFDANYFYGSISTGFEVYENISTGITAKYLYEGLLSDEATGYGFDLGLFYKTEMAGLTFSGVVKNLGSMNKLRSEETKLPSEIRIGPAYNFELGENKFDAIVAGEFQKYLDTDDIHFNLGGEVLYDNLLALRGGYQTGFESKGFTAGLGLMWGSLKFDYAFLPFSLGLGSASLFSVQIKF